MNKTLHLLSLLCFSVATAWADIDISELYLTNHGFDDSEHFDYRRGESGNVAQEILPVFGWEKDIAVDYTVTGVYEIGTEKLFNTSGRIPSAGYDGTQGGCLALSTGWSENLKYYQNVTLPSGNYLLQSAFYNGSNSANGTSLLGWISSAGNVLSETSSFPSGWTLDNVRFSLKNETSGKIQIGFQGAPNGSANSAKVAVDFVRLVLVGDDEALMSNIRATLQSTLNTAKSAYGEGLGNDAPSLLMNITVAQELLDNPSPNYSEIFRMNAQLSAAITKYEWANSTPDDPLDFTRFIENPSFEDDFSGWRQSGFQIQSNTSFPLKNGNQYIEKWVAAGSPVGNAKIEQKLPISLPHGIYTLKVNAQNTQGGKEHQTGMYVFLGNDTVQVSKSQEYALRVLHMEDEISIGANAENASGNWIAVDDFKLFYGAASIEDYIKEIRNRADGATALLSGFLFDGYRALLEEAIEDAEKWMANPSESTISKITVSLRQATEQANRSANAHTRLTEEIQKAREIYDETAQNASDLKKAISDAEQNSKDASKDENEMEKCARQLVSAVFSYQIANSSGDVPMVETNPRHACGSTMAFMRASFVGNDIVEKGICWSADFNPTVLDQRSSLCYKNNGDIFVISDLSPSTFYYLRPYAITSSNTVGYGECIKICTLPQGNVTWSYNNGGSDDENRRINEAVADACDVWNQITSIRGLHLTVSYGASTQTADCSYGGWMRVGPNASYQRTGTIQHEMCHAAGVGTTETWRNSSTYRQETSRGFWLGDRTDMILRFLENNDSAQLKGDDTHFWPYGINGAHEDDGTRMLYYANALIIQALGEDNLPPVQGAFASPAYTFTQDDFETYYVLTEDLKAVQNSNGQLLLKSADWKSILNDESFAWRVRFSPEKQLYQLTNLKSNGSISSDKSMVGMTTGESFAVQMMGARQNIVNEYFNVKSYWMVFPDGTNRPMAMSASSNNVSATLFDHQNSATRQRWILLLKDEVRMLAGEETGLQEGGFDKTVYAYGGEKSITVESGSRGEWVHIYTIDGRLVRMFYMQADMQIVVTNIPVGVYLVNGKKIVVKNE